MNCFNTRYDKIPTEASKCATYKDKRKTACFLSNISSGSNSMFLFLPPHVKITNKLPNKYLHWHKL